MPEREERFVVNAPPEALWNFIRDVESLCSCIPGIERLHVVDDSTVKLTVKEKVGVIPLEARRPSWLLSSRSRVRDISNRSSIVCSKRG
jgi:carbon monoxide dehydrogenase subunit G